MFLPISKRDMKERGWEQADFVYVIGDAYVRRTSSMSSVMPMWITPPLAQPLLVVS